MKNPKILLLDIETSPIISYVWGLFDQNVALNQIKADWHLLSWSAKWLDSKEVLYMDQRYSKNIEDDKKILKSIWKLIDDSDIIISQNGKRFDIKKLNARFIHHGFPPPSSFKHIDTLQIAKKHFAFTSNKLEYMTDKLCTKYKKLKTKKFQGFELWSECLKGNTEAWNEMKKYNMMDVLSLEELYKKLIPWDKTVDFSLYNDNKSYLCSCGSTKKNKNGFHFTAVGKYQRYKCSICHREISGRNNLFAIKNKE